MLLCTLYIACTAIAFFAMHSLALKKGPQSSAQEASDDKKPHVQSSKAIKDPSQMYINTFIEHCPNMV